MGLASNLSMIGAIVTIFLGLGGLIRGWQMKSKKRLDLISDWDNRPLPNPTEHAEGFARVYLSASALLIAMPLLLWAGLHILLWTGIVGVIIWYWDHAIETIARKARGT